MSEIESSFLNEYQNQDEMMQELNLDSHIFLTQVYYSEI